MQDTPRLATANWPKLLSRSLVAGCGFGFEAYANIDKLAESGVETNVLTGDLDAAKLEAFKSVPVPRCLGLHHDQAEVQLAAFCFAKQVLRLTVESFSDYYRRVTDSMKLALRASGFWPVYTNSFMFLKIAFWQWNKRH